MCKVKDVKHISSFGQSSQYMRHKVIGLGKELCENTACTSQAAHQAGGGRHNGNAMTSVNRM